MSVPREITRCELARELSIIGILRGRPMTADDVADYHLAVEDFCRLTIRDAILRCLNEGDAFGLLSDDGVPDPGHLLTAAWWLVRENRFGVPFGCPVPDAVVEHGAFGCIRSYLRRHGLTGDRLSIWMAEKLRSVDGLLHEVSVARMFPDNAPEFPPSPGWGWWETKAGGVS